MKKNIQSKGRRDKRFKLSDAAFETNKKVIARYRAMLEEFSQMSKEELDELRHTKMSQTDFHALKNAISAKRAPAVPPVSQPQ